MKKVLFIFSLMLVVFTFSVTAQDLKPIRIEANVSQFLGLTGEYVFPLGDKQSLGVGIGPVFGGGLGGEAVVRYYPFSIQGKSFYADVSYTFCHTNFTNDDNENLFFSTIGYRVQFFKFMTAHAGVGAGYLTNNNTLQIGDKPGFLFNIAIGLGVIF